MLETSARLLRLLALLHAHPDLSGPDLAQRLDVTTRTVRADVERLRTLGYPVEATIGRIGGYRLGSGGEMPPLLLDDEEAVAVAVGLRVAGTSGVAGIEETSVRSLVKLEQVMPSRLRHRVDALHGAILAVSGTSSPVSQTSSPPSPRRSARASASASRTSETTRPSSASTSNRTAS